MAEIIVWEFVVREGCEVAFEEAYGSHGAWATLFARSAEYRGSELVRLNGAAPRRYLTIDRWTTHDAFARFRDAHAADYEALDARCETFTTREVLVGRGSSLDEARTNAFDGRVHHAVLSAIVRDGRAPKLEDIATSLASSDGEVATSLRRLAASHGLVLHPSTTDVWVAHPFSLSPTSITVATETMTWWAPCLWCATGIVALAAPHATIHARLGGESAPLVMRMKDGELATEEHADLVVHFAIPPRDAWANVVHYCATVLPFRDEHEVDASCARHGLPRGKTVPLARVIALGRAWYGRHLAEDWVKWTTSEARAIFRSVGLVDEFWHLPEGDERF